MRRRISLYSLLVAGAAAMAAIGCRDGATPATVAGPAAGSQAPSLDRSHAYREDEALDDDGDGGARLLACAPHASSTATALIGASGGTIAVGDDRLVIPGGALSGPTLITATIPADTLADIEFEPHGLHFSKDVILVLSTGHCNVGQSPPGHVVYLDNDGTVLETLDAMFNGGSRTVTTKIHHFSSYAIAL